MSQNIIYTPTDIVSLISQLMELSMPIITVEGEIVNIRVSKSRWLYFDIKDEYSIIHCFGTIYMRVSGFRDGARARVMLSPRMHPQFGFGFTVQSIELSEGEGETTKAKKELEDKLEKEGIFDQKYKTDIPKKIRHIGVIASKESAALKDFITLLDSYVSDILVTVFDVNVQGRSAESSIVKALHYFNRQKDVDVLVLTRGGGSPEDLAIFNEERLVREVFSSQIPTISAIGHEVDKLLVERAADIRASTPSHAAEILRSKIVDGRIDYRQKIQRIQAVLDKLIEQKSYSNEMMMLKLGKIIDTHVREKDYSYQNYIEQLEARNPLSVMKQGYALLFKEKQRLSSLAALASGDKFKIRMNSDEISAIVE